MIEQLLSTFSAHSQASSLGLKSFLTMDCGNEFENITYLPGYQHRLTQWEGRVKGMRDARETGKQEIFHPKLFHYKVRRPPLRTRGGFLTSGIDLLYFLIVNFSVPKLGV